MSIRSIQILSVYLAMYSAVLLLFIMPYLWVAVTALGIWHLRKKDSRLSSHGTARWSNSSDLKGMIDE